MQSLFLQLLQIDHEHRRKTARRRCLLAVFILAVAGNSCAQISESVNSIHTLAVASLGDGAQARAVRHQIIVRLEKSGIKVVEDPAAADAELRGASSIWATGTVVIDPHSTSSRQTNYLGYVSMELVGKGNQPLWSYLVTPSRFRSGSITADLADHAATRLLNAIESAASGPAAPPSRPRPNVALHAAGATLPAPLYLQWFDSSGIRVSYDAIGSEAGIQELKEGKVDFAASDIPLTSQESTGPVPVIEIPTVVGGVVPIYNVPGLGRALDLTPEVLAGIYSGKIRKWNDPALRKSNPGAPLPDAQIAVIHRSDGSGTTFVWTSFLSAVNPEWKTSFGAGPRVAWPVGTGADGNKGVADLVQKTPNAIGYVELIYAIQHQLEYASVRNPAGRFIKADLASITAAASEAATSPDRASILNARNKAAYPLSTFTWILIPREGADPAKKAAIADLLKWMLTSGQKQCAFLGYPPLPREVAARALAAVDQLK